MNKKDKNRTVRTKNTGSSDYKGYCSHNVANNYDDISTTMKNKASSLGGVLDNSTDKYHGNRFRFSSKESRDDFNKALDKEKKNKTKKPSSTSGVTTESIGRIIKEELLRELEYSTHESARQKALERGDKERARKFAQARNKAFNAKFGTEVPVEKGEGFRVAMMGDDEPYLSMSQRNRDRIDTYDSYHLSPRDYSNPRNTRPYSHITGEVWGADTYNNEHSYEKSPSAKGNKRFARAMAKADNEFRDHLDGINQYVKGKGYVKQGKPQGASIENPDGTPNTGKKPNQRDWHEYMFDK